MALADITLNDGQGTPAAHVFTYVGTVNNRIVRSEIAAAPETPQYLTHAHSESKRNGVTTKSHLLRIDKTVLDGDGITPHTANIRVMCDIPNPILSDALLADLAAYVRNWASAVNVQAWGRGSVG